MITRVVNIKTDKYDIYIGRANKTYGLEQSKWANPFVIGKDGTREEVIQKCRQYVLASPRLMRDIQELKGKTLGCWCKPAACHGDIYVEILEKNNV